MHVSKNRHPNSPVLLIALATTALVAGCTDKSRAAADYEDATALLNQAPFFPMIARTMGDHGADCTDLSAVRPKDEDAAAGFYAGDPRVDLVVTCGTGPGERVYDVRMAGDGSIAYVYPPA